MDNINIDGIDYSLENANEAVKSHLLNLQFVNEQILQRNNELQIALTAKIGYKRALDRELNK